MTKFLHTMIRVTDPAATIAFFALIGVHQVRRFSSETGRFTLIFLAAPGEEGVAEVELTHNWDPEDYSGGRAGTGRLSGPARDSSRRCRFPKPVRRRGVHGPR